MEKWNSKYALWCVASLLTAMLAAPALAAVSNADEAGTFVHMFEWKWADIATECEGPLRAKGYAGVQVSPPQESISGSQWWTRYQPRSYNIMGRSGTQAEFQNMVSRCNTAGIKVYVDAVVNHMSAEHAADGFTAINYPAVPYTGTLDFHNWNCPSINYQDRAQVQNCSLVGLNDLKTESEYVRNKVATYMNTLTGWGVGGFRIDAAKHIPAADIANILGRLNGSPYVYQEVLGAPGEAVQPAEYLGNADVYETGYQYWMTQYFRNPGTGLAGLQNQFSSLMASNKAVVFTDSHDTPRDGSGDNDLTYKEGARYTLANVFMLAYPYGYPKVMSGYKWTDPNAGPPANGPNSGDSCFTGNWQCDHRNRAIANMVQFRKTTAGQPVANWTNINNLAIAFGRGNRGFVVINKDPNAITTVLNTGLPNGMYCDIANADYSNNQCLNGAAAGPTISVSNGQATFSVAGTNAAAIHVDARVTTSAACNVPSMNLRGTNNNWGNSPMACTGNNTWSVSATFASTATERFKFDMLGNWATNYGDNNADGIGDLNGSDIAIAAGTYTITFNSQTLAYTKTCTAGVCLGGGTVNIAFQCNNGTTSTGQSVYVVGSTAQFGTWAPANALKLNPTAYPTWTGTFPVTTSNTAIQWKCLKRNDTNPAAGIVWQGGANNSVVPNVSKTVVASF